MLCSEISKAIDTGIKRVTSDMNYVNTQYSLTFLCECKQVEINHPGVLGFLAGKPVSLSCSKSEGNSGSGLPTGYELWQLTQKHISAITQSKPSNSGKGMYDFLMLVGCNVGMQQCHVYM